MTFQVVRTTYNITTKIRVTRVAYTLSKSQAVRALAIVRLLGYAAAWVSRNPQLLRGANLADVKALITKLDRVDDDLPVYITLDDVPSNVTEYVCIEQLVEEIDEEHINHALDV